MKATEILRYIIYIGVAALLFTPFIVSGSMYFPYITGKAFYFRIIVALVFGAWVILALYDKSARPKFSWVSAAVLAFVLVPLLGVIFGVNTHKSVWSNFERMIGWITIFHVGLLFAAASHTLKEKQWHYVFYLSLLVSVVIGIIGFTEVGSVDRVDATLGNPIYLGMYALFHAFLAGFYLVRRIRRAIRNSQSLLVDWQVYAFSALSAFNLIVMWLTGTRGAILGALAGVFIAALTTAVFQRKRPVIRSVATAGVILPLIAVGLFFGFRDTEFVQEQPVVGRFAQIDLDEGNAGSRLDTWAIGLEGYTKRPLTGWGMGNFNYVFDRYYRPSMHDDAQWFDRAHNVLVEWLVAAGPLGLLAYLSLFVAAVYLIWRRPQSGEPLSVVEKSVLIGLLASYLVQNLFVFDHLVSYIMFALLLAWLHARSGRMIPQPRPSLSLSAAGKAWTATGVAVATLVLVGVWNWPGYTQARGVIDGLRLNSQARQLQQQRGMEAANQVRKQALDTFEETIAIGAMGTQEARERLSQAAISVARNTAPDSSIARQYQAAADAHMRAQINAESDDLRHRVFYGDLLMAYDQYPKAIEQYSLAKEMSQGQKQDILFSLGEAYRADGQTEKALAQYRQAYELPTSFDDVAIRYATALIQADRLDQSDEVLNDHFGTTTVASQELISAYESLGYTERTIPILERRVEMISKNQIGIRQAAQRYVSLAAGYEQVGRREDAVSILQEAQREFPQAADQIGSIIESIESGGAVQQ